MFYSLAFGITFLMKQANMNYNRETVRNGVTNPPNSYNIEPNIGPNIIPMPVDISSKLITFD